MKRGRRFDDAGEILIAKRCGVNFGSLFLPFGELFLGCFDLAVSLQRTAEKRILAGEERTSGRFIGRAVF